MKFVNVPAEERDNTFDKILAMGLADRSDVLSRLYGRLELTEAFEDIKRIVEEVYGA